MGKIVDQEELIKIRELCLKQNKKIILCHGVFDLLHPGHIKHFQEAKLLGDILVVSITSANYVRKGPGRPYFNDQLRLESIAALECVDYVILSKSYVANEIIKVVKPSLYVKGQEYKDAEKDITGKILEEKELVQKYGGDIYYTKGEVFSSTEIINKAFPVFSDDLKNYLQHFKQKWTLENIQQYTSKMEKLKVLVLGDVIIDDYVFCKVQGLMSKNNGYSAKFLREEKYLGGSLAIARHISDFCSDVTLMSVMGDEEEYINLAKKTANKNVSLDVINSSLFSTIVKKRYVEPDDKRKELNKVFVINNLPETMIINDKVLREMKIKLKKKINDYDVIFLCDFGHGLIDDEVISIVENSTTKIVLNCQTNSSNYGLNLITKYKRADFFSIDEKELRLAFSNYIKSNENLLKELANKLHGCGWLTRGSKGALSVDGNGLCECPAFVLDVVDTIGAGDAFYSMAGLTVAAGAPVDVGTFMGNIAGALATNIIGNEKSINKVDVLKYATTLLKG